MSIKDEFSAALNKVLEGRVLRFEESLELMVYLNKVSTEVASQLADHFRRYKDEGEGQGRSSQGGTDENDR